jgi:hypothetical protein
MKKTEIYKRLEYVRDVRKKRLVVIISRLDTAGVAYDRVVKTFHMSQLAEAEKYAERSRPARITDTKDMSVIRAYINNCD